MKPDVCKHCNSTIIPPVPGYPWWVTWVSPTISCHKNPVIDRHEPRGES